MRLLPLVLLAGCLHAPPSPLADVAACVVPRVVSAITFDVVLPVMGGRRSGTLTIDATGCGPAVVDVTQAERAGAAVALATPGLVALVQLSDDPCADAWAQTVGLTVSSVARSLPDALADRGPVVVVWGVPECSP